MSDNTNSNKVKFSWKDALTIVMALITAVSITITVTSKGVAEKVNEHDRVITAILVANATIQADIKNLTNIVGVMSGKLDKHMDK